MELKLINSFKKGKPKGKMYSLKCGQCGNGFLSSYTLDARICGNCLQTAKSSDSIDYDVECSSCDNKGVIYSKKTMLLMLFWIRDRT